MYNYSCQLAQNNVPNFQKTELAIIITNNPVGRLFYSRASWHFAGNGQPSRVFYCSRKEVPKVIEKLEHIKALNGMPDEEWRFWAKVDTNGPTMPNMTTPCWVWKAGTNSGYGIFSFRGRPTPAHRCAWFYTFGEVLSSETVLMHQCDNPPCVNPEHLTPGTHFENALDMAHKGRAPILPKERLSYEQAQEIRQRYETENITQSQLAKEYGITLRSMQRLIGGHSFKSYAVGVTL